MHDVGRHATLPLVAKLCGIIQRRRIDVVQAWLGRMTVAGGAAGGILNRPWLYSERSVHRLRFIRAAQAIGFALDDIRALLGERDRPLSCREVQALIDARLADVEKRLKDLRHVQRALKFTLAKCQNSEGQACYVMDSLRNKSTAS